MVHNDQEWRLNGFEEENREIAATLSKLLVAKQSSHHF